MVFAIFSRFIWIFARLCVSLTIVEDTIAQDNKEK